MPRIGTKRTPNNQASAEQPEADKAEHLRHSALMAQHGSLCDHSAAMEHSRIRSALTHAANHRYHLAARHLLKATHTSTPSARALTLLGHIYHSYGRCQEALQFYRRAVALDPSRPGITEAVARAATLAGSYDEAAAAYSAIGRSAPSRRSALLAYARAEAAKGNVPTAVLIQHMCRRLEMRRPADRPTLDTKWNSLQRSGDECTVALVAGDAFARSNGVQVYLRSLASLFSGDKHILAFDVTNHARHAMAAMGFIVTPVTTPLGWLTRDRWILYYEFFRHTTYKTCLVSDSRDVLFQRNPFSYQVDPGVLLLVSEGVSHSKAKWNLDQQLGLQSSLAIEAPPQQWDVVNAGVQYGSTDRMRDLCLLMYSNLFLSDPNSSDQAMLNYLYHNLLHTHDGYRVVTRSLPFCAIGVRASARTRQSSLRWRAGIVHRNSDIPFAVVHQWDRTPFRRRITAAVLGSDSRDCFEDPFCRG